MDRRIEAGVLPGDEADGSSRAASNDFSGVGFMALIPD
jgi:hypothetical protein